MDKSQDIKKQIVATLKEKSATKQVVYDQTKAAFKIVKTVLQNIVDEYNESLKGSDERIMLEYRDRGMFEAEIKVAGDLLIFNMHSNIFEFDYNHPIWRNHEAKNEPIKTYSGIINIYNFLADSFKYQRLEDLGYLVGRMFVNMEGSFFVEGRRELGFYYPAFGKNLVSYENIRVMIESAVIYALKFDLLVPPYEEVKISTVEIMKEKINKSKVKTGKRMGFAYNVDLDKATTIDTYTDCD